MSKIKAMQKKFQGKSGSLPPKLFQQSSPARNPALSAVVKFKRSGQNWGSGAADLAPPGGARARAAATGLGSGVRLDDLPKSASLPRQFPEDRGTATNSHDLSR